MTKSTPKKLRDDYVKSNKAASQRALPHDETSKLSPDHKHRKRGHPLHHVQSSHHIVSFLQQVATVGEQSEEGTVVSKNLANSNRQAVAGSTIGTSNSSVPVILDHINILRFIFVLSFKYIQNTLKSVEIYEPLLIN